MKVALNSFIYIFFLCLRKALTSCGILHREVLYIKLAANTNPDRLELF